MLLRTYAIILLAGYSIYSQVSLLTGQSGNQIQLVPGSLTIKYQGSVSKTVVLPNENEATSWLCLGWSYGSPSISTMHNNTVSYTDDRWFFENGTGAGTEIIRVIEGSAEKFYLKNDPYSKVEVTKGDNGDGIQIIKSWKITGVDGSISRYGYVSGRPEDAMRYLPAWGNAISQGSTKAATPSDPPAWFIYRWDLKEMETVDGNKTVYEYERDSFIRTTETNYHYVGESYLKKITTPFGETV